MVERRFPPSAASRLSFLGQGLLNILQNFDLKDASSSQYLHDYLEASRIAFADRNRWVGDPSQVDVPTQALLSQRFADSRACLIKPDTSLTSPLAPADPRPPHERGDEAAPAADAASTLVTIQPCSRTKPAAIPNVCRIRNEIAEKMKYPRNRPNSIRVGLNRTLNSSP